jgi:hypothetical protein
MPLEEVREAVGDAPYLRLLYRAVREGGCVRRRKALVALAALRQVGVRDTARALHLSQKTVKSYLADVKVFELGRGGEKEVYVVGKTDAGWAGLRTQVVET